MLRKVLARWHLAGVVVVVLMHRDVRAEAVGADRTPDPAPAIQFESDADVDWEPYSRTLKERVRLHWRVPEIARHGWRGAVTFHFFIARDGRLQGLDTVLSRGRDPLASAARAALEAASPFPAPPLPKNGDDRVGVTWSFYYNMDDSRIDRWQRKVKAARQRSMGAE